MSRKLVAVVLGATLMLGVVGVGAAQAGAQPTSAQVNSLNLLVAELDEVCSYRPRHGYPESLETACALLPALKAVVDQINEVCDTPGLPDFACAPWGW
jgi:hypothetical protein